MRSKTSPPFPAPAPAARDVEQKKPSIAEPKIGENLNFLAKYTEVKYDEEKLINSINSTKFDNLKKLEDKHGFNMGQKNKFFHLGEKNDWKTLLDTKISSKINNKFKIEMKELGYN